jgi:glycosyltransferase involved in cell wall biosynthesis
MRELPLVSCLMPTKNRRHFVPQAIVYYQRQDYSNRELLILDDGDDPVGDLIPDDPTIRYVRLDRPYRLGPKRNLACQLARGEILAHWDDDDWYAPWRLSHQVSGMQEQGVELSGSPRALFLELGSGRAWRYDYPAMGRPWLNGASLCYARTLWDRIKFEDVEQGEDALFAWSISTFNPHMPDPELLVGLIHGSNAAPKIVSDRGWQPCPPDQVLQVMGQDVEFYGTLRPPLRSAPSTPMVSCIVPTYNRRPFIRQSIKYFLAQDYPARELIIVDDGSDPVGNEIPKDDRIRYVRLGYRRSIGAKRNLACEMARGEIILQWDDDDWHGPGRISHQVADIATNLADLTGLHHGLLLETPTSQFWSCREDLHARMFFQSRSIHGGTLAFRKSVWLNCGGYPDQSLAEDAVLMQRAITSGARVLRLANAGTYVYVRHETNSWRFNCGDFGGPEGWSRAQPPRFMPQEDIDFYRALRGVGVAGAAGRS